MDHLDENAMDSDEFADLHEAIEDGDLESVRLAVESHEEELFFSFEETSALSKAFKCKNYEISSFLIHKGAKFIGSENRYAYEFDIDLDRLNHLLLQYNQKTEKACIYRLISFSQSPQVLDGERLKAITSMYEHFFKSDIIKLLMEVLEREPFDIVFDFESGKVNRVHRENYEEDEIFGLTLSNSKQIFVGAKNLLSRDPRKRAKVYGVVAEELCHLAMTTVFKNNAKPYREEDSDLKQEFHDIVLAVKALTARSCHTASVIQDVFENYKGYAWECELIARVPHVIGIHGEDEGRKIFQESSELYRLLQFYEQNVQEMCKLCTDPSLNTRSHREMERIVTKDIISYKEKQIRPLNEDFQSFRKYLVEWESISVITTNCTRLCMLHVYHELKREYGFLLEKKCLFFSRKCFEKKIYEIRDAMKGNLWDYLVLVMDKRELNMSRFQAEYIDHLKDFTTNGMKLTMISSSQSTDEEFDFEKAVNYKWSDLSEEYKYTLQGLRYLFKGEEEVTYVRKENFQKVFSEDDISVIISGELTEIDDGNELFSEGYIPETYIEREFHSTVVDDKIFRNLHPHTNIILYGLAKGKHEKMPFNKDQVQWVLRSDEIQRDKCVFIIDKDTPISFEEIRDRNPNKKFIWLHYDEKEFYVRNLSSSGDVFGRLLKQKSVSEEEILKFLIRRRTVIISDNAGYGKSTVISNLIANVKKNNYRSWSWRINFNKFSGDITDPLSIANVEEKGSDEEVLNHLFRMLGLKNGLERHLFMKFSKEGRCFIFFDGFDEIPSDYVSNALKLLSTVRKQTAVNMIISTRKHHQKDLEQLFNTYSHQLTPLSKENQVRYLEQLWKNKLKYPFGKRTSHINFRKLAANVIDRTSFDREIQEFMGIPLHLFMVGVIFFDGDFNVEISSDIHDVYSEFIEKKILIYVEEKQGILYHGRGKKSIIEKERRDVYRIHIQLSNKLMDEGKIDCKMSEEDLELCSALGIVFIKGAEIDFLHHTFAEFFRAESIRLNLNKSGFCDVLFDDKYDVVIRFLESSLEGKNFENLTKEFFEDMNFLFDVLSKFVDKYKYVCNSEDKFGKFYRNNELDARLSLVSKIVKNLLQKFESTVDSDMLDLFVVELESRLLALEEWLMVGGCMTVKMVKALLDRNFELYFEMIFGVVKYYSKPAEVTELLQECISIKTNAKLETNENLKAESLWELFQFRRLSKFRKLFKFTEEKNLFEYAIWNVRLEIFANILQFFEGILGKEQFIDKTILSEEYVEAIEGFLDYVDADRIAGLIKELQSYLGGGMEIAFDKNLIFRVLWRAVDTSKRMIPTEDEWGNEFRDMIDLFKEHFGVEILKEAFLSRDPRGYCLIHILASEDRNLTENLNIIKAILDDDNIMIQFIMFKDRELNNIFNMAAESEGINFDKILEFCFKNLMK